MDLFWGITFFMPAVTAAGELKHSDGGVLRYLITVPPAFALGALIVWVDWKLGKAVWLRYQGYPKQAQNMLGFAWIVLDLFWIMIGAFLGSKLASSITW